MRIVGLFLVLLVLLAGGWTAFWFYAADEAKEALDGWMAQEQAQGRHWACPARTVTGFPLGLEVACDHPQFSGVVLGDTAQGSLGALRMRAALTDPHRATLTLASPFAYKTQDGQTDFTITWSRMDVDLDGLPSAITTAKAAGRDIAVQGRFGTPDTRAGHAATGDVTLVAVAGTPDPTIDFAITVGQVGVPLLDALVGGVEPADLAFMGRLSQAALLDAPSSAALIDRWRRAGGMIAFTSARVSRGPSQVDASGPLRLDETHRPEGKLDASFTGVGPILRRYGINPNIATAGAILNSLFGGNRNAPPHPADGPDTIRLPIVLRNGRLGIGPVLTPVSLPPLY